MFPHCWWEMVVLSVDWSRALRLHQQLQRSVSKPTRLVNCLRLDAAWKHWQTKEAVCPVEWRQRCFIGFKARRPRTLVWKCLRLWFMWLLLFLPHVRNWCNLAVVKLNFVLSINAKIKSNSATTAYHWIDENKLNTMVKSLSQSDNYGGRYYMFCSSWIYFGGNISR